MFRRVGILPGSVHRDLQSGGFRPVDVKNMPMVMNAADGERTEAGAERMDPQDIAFVGTDAADAAWLDCRD